ncbi:MAG: hypothetical protein ACK559_38035, partial [bacterium]
MTSLALTRSTRSITPSLGSATGGGVHGMDVRSTSVRTPSKVPLPLPVSSSVQVRGSSPRPGSSTHVKPLLRSAEISTSSG